MQNLTVAAAWRGFQYGHTRILVWKCSFRVSAIPDRFSISGKREMGKQGA